MNKILIIGAALMAVFQGNALANDSGIDYTFSTKLWNNEVKVVQSPGTSVTTNKANGPILALTARKGDYFGSKDKTLI